MCLTLKKNARNQISNPNPRKTIDVYKIYDYGQRGVGLGDVMTVRQFYQGQEIFIQKGIPIKSGRENRILTREERRGASVTQGIHCFLDIGPARRASINGIGRTIIVRCKARAKHFVAVGDFHDSACSVYTEITPEEIVYDKDDGYARSGYPVF